MAAKVYSGSISVDCSGTSETTLKEITLSARTRISSIWIDANGCDGDLSVKLYAKIDGSNYRQIANYDYSLSATDSINLLSVGGYIENDDDIKVTVTPNGGGSAAQTVYYRIPYDDSIEKLQSVFNGTGATDDVDLQARSLEIDNDAGAGIYVTGSTHGISCASGASDGYGFLADGYLAGACLRGTSEENANGVYIVGEGNKSAVLVEQNDSGHGIDVNAAADYALLLQGGGNAAALIEATGGNTPGLKIIGSGSGQGVDINAGSTGIGVDISGGGTSGDGLNVSATDGDAARLEANGANQNGLNISSASDSAVVALGDSSYQDIEAKELNTTTEGTTTPSSSAVLADKIEFIFQALKNQTVSTGSLVQIAKDDDTVISEAAITKAAGSLTRAKFANP